MFRRWLSAALLCGCGRFGFGNQGTSDAASDTGIDGPSTDAAICHSGTFGTPQLIASTATGSEEGGPSISPDELTMYFTSNRNGGQQRAIWVATRPSRTVDFDPPALVSAIDSSADENSAEISDDELTLYYASTRSGSAQIYDATRPDTAAAFIDQGLLTISGSPATTAQGAAVTSDELMMVYTYNALDLALATRPDRGSLFAHQRLLDEVNVPQSDGDPTISADGLELFFETYRTGPGEIFTSLRASTSDPFPAPTELTALDIFGMGAGAPDISADGRTLYFYITNGQLDLYTATRDCP